MQQTFKQWLAAVDAVLIGKCGLSHLDLADQTWHDWWGDDMTPEKAANEALENEGFPSDELD